MSAQLFGYESIYLGSVLWPADDTEADVLVSNARKSGFSGACYVDFPHRGLANKYFLCLTKNPDAPQRHMDSYSCPLAFPTQCKPLIAGHKRRCTGRLAYMMHCNVDCVLASPRHMLLTRHWLR